VLSSRPGANAWNAFFELVHASDAATDFMSERPLNILPPAQGVFDDDQLAQDHAERT